jgi:hypothetical protein
VVSVVLEPKPNKSKNITAGGLNGLLAVIQVKYIKSIPFEEGE